MRLGCFFWHFYFLIRHNFTLYLLPSHFFSSFHSFSVFCCVSQSWMLHSVCRSEPGAEGLAGSFFFIRHCGVYRSVCWQTLISSLKENQPKHVKMRGNHKVWGFWPDRSWKLQGGFSGVAAQTQRNAVVWSGLLCPGSRLEGSCRYVSDAPSVFLAQAAASCLLNPLEN